MNVMPGSLFVGEIPAPYARDAALWRPPKGRLLGLGEFTADVRAVEDKRWLERYRGTKSVGGFSRGR